MKALSDGNDDSNYIASSWNLINWNKVLNTIKSDHIIYYQPFVLYKSLLLIIIMIFYLINYILSEGKIYDKIYNFL
jgi:hypothetical protein